VYRHNWVGEVKWTRTVCVISHVTLMYSMFEVDWQCGCVCQMSSVEWTVRVRTQWQTRRMCWTCSTTPSSTVTTTPRPANTMSLYDPRHQLSNCYYDAKTHTYKELVWQSLYDPVTCKYYMTPSSNVAMTWRPASTMSLYSRLLQQH